MVTRIDGFRFYNGARGAKVVGNRLYQELRIGDGARVVHTPKGYCLDYPGQIVSARVAAIIERGFTVAVLRGGNWLPVQVRIAPARVQELRAFYGHGIKERVSA